MIDNLFLVESPLQALVAVELSLQFQGQTSGIIYQFSESVGRQRNNDQLCAVIELGNWSFQERFISPRSSGLDWHIDFKKTMSELKRRYQGSVRNLFFGEFRAQWMHFARLVIAPEKFVLIDDGAVTLTVKSRFIDQGIFFPAELWESKNLFRKMVKKVIYWGLFDPKQMQRPVSFASAFLREESEFRVDFSSIRRLTENRSRSEMVEPPKAYFFGSKYSEAGIVERDYELNFLSGVIEYYKGKGLGFVYCAHREESDEKLEVIKALGYVEVLRPDLPAELFVVEHDSEIAEIGAAYSSVVTNLRLIFPDKPITSFRLNSALLNPMNREAIDLIYHYFEKSGVLVKDL